MRGARNDGLIARMKLSPDEPLHIVGKPLFRAVGDEVFILMPDSMVHWLKNATAKVVWDHLIASGDVGASPTELATLLAQGFEVTAEQARADVLAFLGQLTDRGLVAPVTAARAGKSPD